MGGGTLSEKGQLHLRRLLIERLCMNERANEYAKALHLHKLPPLEAWVPSVNANKAHYDYATFQRNMGLVEQSRLFHPADPPKGPYSPYYRKPAQYLVGQLSASGLSDQEARQALERLLEWRKDGGFRDTLTSKYLASSRHSLEFDGSAKSSLGKLKQRKVKQSRPSISDIGWM